MFEIETAYPTTPPELLNVIKTCDLIKEEYILVRYTSEEMDIIDDAKADSLLADSTYSEVAKIKHKDYFGDEFNTALSFSNFTILCLKQGDDRMDLKLLNSASTISYKSRI